MRKIISILILFTLCSSIQLSAQDTIINGKRYRLEENKTSKSGKYIAPLDSEFVMNNKRLKYYNNWLTVGAGLQQNLSYRQALGFAGGLDYNFHLKQHYFQLGTVITGEKFGYYNNYNFHLGYGRRHENRDFHYAAFAGISYSTGYGKVDSVYSRKYDQPGIFVQGELIKKITYDVGIGAAFFADWNAEQAIIGLRAVLYFSGAYKGKKNKGREDY